MPDLLDRLQEKEATELEARNRRARLPDVLPTKERDCIDCGEPIPPARLAAVPAALRCITCAEAAQRRARLSRGTA